MTKGSAVPIVGIISLSPVNAKRDNELPAYRKGVGRLLWAIAAAAVVLAILLLGRVRLCVKLHIGMFFADVGLCFRVFLGLIPFNLRYRIVYDLREKNEATGIRLLRYERRGGFKLLKTIGEKNKKKRKKKNTDVDRAVIRAIRSGMTLESVEVTGEIGIPSDAFWCVLSAGIIHILLENAIRLGVPAALDKKQPSSLIVNFFPCTTRRAFNLKLEGILSAIPLKLIKNAAAAAIKDRKGVKK